MKIESCFLNGLNLQRFFTWLVLPEVIPGIQRCPSWLQQTSQQGLLFQRNCFEANMILMAGFWVFFRILFIYSWKREREREREAQTQAEREAGSMQEARHGTRSRDPRIMPWAEGGTKPLSHPNGSFWSVVTEFLTDYWLFLGMCFWGGGTIKICIDYFVAPFP